MEKIKIHILHTGKVCVSPDLPFGGENCSLVKASGVFAKEKDRIWLPVSSYLIESDKGTVLFDCGWHRNMSPQGILDKKAQIKSLGSRMLYKTNQGLLPAGEAVNEQLEAMDMRTEDIDIVLLSHLDCDHANGLKLVDDAKQILVSQTELEFADRKTPSNRIRYNRDWWSGTKIRGFDWNGTEGPFGKSYDVFGDGSVVMINIPGHSEGQCALKVTGSDGRFVLLYADGGYAEKSWREQIVSGISDDRAKQKKSLEWIREQSLDSKCAESLANHDTEIKPHIILL